MAPHSLLLPSLSKLTVHAGHRDAIGVHPFTHPVLRGDLFVGQPLAPDMNESVAGKQKHACQPIRLLLLLFIVRSQQHQAFGGDTHLFRFMVTNTMSKLVHQVTRLSRGRMRRI
ncbi:hypothetical protein X992_5481 [Burkholderia pseudomallei MSHR5492]|nr:hypothetical protein X992_5481 [Burkholderia pseudomallei MSHR5492]